MNKNDKFKQTLDAAFDSIKSGHLKITDICLHDGEVQYYMGEEFTSKYFKAQEDGATQATSLMLGELRKSLGDKQSGTLSFTVELQDGKTKAAHIQKTYKHYIKLDIPG